MTKHTSRKASVAGAFYPAEADEVLRYFEHFNSLIESPTISSKVVIVPHAGYVYSGFTANVAYKALKNSGLKNFLVVGPSHRVGYDGSSICNFESYETPFGNLLSDSDMSKDLITKFGINSFEQAHHEHSTEVQFPFIKHYIPDAKIVELVYSRENPDELSKILKYVCKKDDWGIIISTDLSHFYSLENANKLDSICVNAIKDLNLSLLSKGCEACGIIGVEAIMITALELGLKANILDYRTSADASEDTSSVVGYLSACFT